MSDKDWGELEEAFFAAGEVEGQHTDAGASALAHVSHGDHDFRDLDPGETPLPFRMVAQARLGELRERARHLLLWHGRMIQFRLAVTLFAGAEHALRAVSSRAFHPRRVVRRPWLLRACIVVLASSATSYSAAAVLVASGAL